MILCVCLCRNVGSRWALEQAKYNLVNEYLLVGVTEELEDFIMMLEAALPRFFRGATELYRTGSLSIFKNYRNSSTTNKNKDNSALYLPSSFQTQASFFM